MNNHTLHVTFLIFNVKKTFSLVKATFITYYKLVESLNYLGTQNKFHIEMYKKYKIALLFKIETSLNSCLLI